MRVGTNLFTERNVSSRASTTAATCDQDEKQAKQRDASRLPDLAEPSDRLSGDEESVRKSPALPWAGFGRAKLADMPGRFADVCCASCERTPGTSTSVRSPLPSLQNRTSNARLGSRCWRTIVVSVTRSHHRAKSARPPAGGALRDRRRWRKWQGCADSNRRPSVLETDALPTELHPCRRSRLYSAGARLASDESIPV